jgi:hypothetical protein
VAKGQGPALLATRLLASPPQLQPLRSTAPTRGRNAALLQPHFSKHLCTAHPAVFSATVRFIKIIIRSDLSSHGSVSIRVGVETNCRRSEAVRASPHCCIFLAAVSTMSQMDLMLGPGTGILSMKMAISLQHCPLPPFKGCMRWSC